MATKAHAVHNKAASVLLLADGHFNDWVVTTAFYAALHFVQTKIFPHTEAGTTFQNVDQYMLYVESTTGRRTNKHAVTIDLVKKQLPTVRTEYRKLFDVCMNARYGHYKVPKNMAQDAHAELALIEGACK